MTPLPFVIVRTVPIFTSISPLPLPLASIVVLPIRHSSLGLLVLMKVMLIVWPFPADTDSHIVPKFVLIFSFHQASVNFSPVNASFTLAKAISLRTRLRFESVSNQQPLPLALSIDCF